MQPKLLSTSQLALLQKLTSWSSILYRNSRDSENKTIWKKRNKSGRFTLSNFKSYKATIIKTVWYWYKDRHIDYWKRIESSEINLRIYGKLIFDKSTKTIQWGKKQSFKLMMLEELDILMGKKVNLNPFLNTVHN